MERELQWEWGQYRNEWCHTPVLTTDMTCVAVNICCRSVFLNNDAWLISEPNSFVKSLSITPKKYET
jgi:hypothetical protein